MSDLSPQARALLRAARSYDEPTDADARRVRVSVLTKVAAGVGAAAGLTSYASGASALLAGATVKIGAAVLLCAGIGTYAAVQLRAPAPEHVRPAVVQTQPTKAPERLLAVAPVEEAPALQVESKGRVHASGPSHRRRTTADLEGEARLLEEADAEIRAGNPSAALVRLAEHAAKYPTGALSDEREGVRAIALCRAGRSIEGRAAADKFLSGTRKTSLAARVRTACSMDKPE